MEEWLRLATKGAVVVIDAMALIIVAIGTIEAFFVGLRVAFPAGAGSKPAVPRGPAALRTLVGCGLTFQLAADIIETWIAPSWQELGQLAAIAVIRTFLNFFLERDLAELDDRADTHARP